jgi:RNA polymerase sigma-70 factor (ECF subfamily)
MAEGRLVRQFLENRDAILGFLFALIRDPDASEEVFQDLAMVVMDEDRRGTAVVHFHAWVREVARRRVADYFRKRARRQALEQPADDLVDVVSQAFAENEAIQERQRLRLQALLECVERLSGRSREVIEGYYGRRLSLKDLAAEMAWQVNSVKVALSRARKALADCVNTRLSLREAT